MFLSIVTQALKHLICVHGLTRYSLLIGRTIYSQSFRLNPLVTFQLFCLLVTGDIVKPSSEVPVLISAVKYLCETVSRVGTAVTDRGSFDVMCSVIACGFRSLLTEQQMNREPE